jgi:D-arabinose 1-dehydrogenase-like Zn-dependent alcohol dehydrogenase
MRHLDVAKGKKVGVVGLGGLGHMAVKFARALGVHVVVFTTSPNKKDDALRLGADEVVVSRNADEMRKHAGASISFSMPFPPITILTPISNSFGATVTSPWLARQVSRWP